MKEDVDVLIIGAGVIGITTAYFLSRAGFSVLVVEKLPGPALETSFANGGQLSLIDVTSPLADLPTIFTGLSGDRADLSPIIHAHFDFGQLRWLANCVLESIPFRRKRAAQSCLRLVQQSIAALSELRRRENLDRHFGKRGAIKFFRDPARMKSALRDLEIYSANGVEYDLVDASQISTLEPALEKIAGSIAGGIYSPGDEVGDCHEFTKELETICICNGVRLLYQHELETFEPHEGQPVIRTASIKDLGSARYREIRAKWFVVAAGVWSTNLLRTIHVNINVYPVKGYSVTIESSQTSAPSVTVTDADNHCVFSRFSGIFRAAGTVEVDNWQDYPGTGRADRILALMRGLFPDAGDYSSAKVWTGLRPLTPDGLPQVHRSRFRNLIINTGHGTLGWTLSVGSAARVAEIIQDDRGGSV